jgi:fructokinase
MSKPVIVGIGEALFDVYGEQARLGGAPLNLAVHAHQLGNEGVVVSRVGQDDRGRFVAEELARRGMTTEHLQTDPDLATGTVLVDLDDKGEPSYQILPGVAWDALQFDPDLETLARRCAAVCFGTLAQRQGQTRNTIYRFLQAAPQAIRLLDVNLRQDFYDRRTLQRSLELATAVKLNGAELRVLDEQMGLGATFDDAAAGLLKKFANLKWLALTRGAEGTAVYTPSERFTADPVVIDVVDAVGAGDSAAAALLHGAVRRWPWARSLTLANRLGAFVATQSGACPPLPQEILGLTQG